MWTCGVYLVYIFLIVLVWWDFWSSLLNIYCKNSEFLLSQIWLCQEIFEYGLYRLEACSITLMPICLSVFALPQHLLFWVATRLTFPVNGGRSSLSVSYLLLMAELAIKPHSSFLRLPLVALQETKLSSTTLSPAKQRSFLRARLSCCLGLGWYTNCLSCDPSMGTFGNSLWVVSLAADATSFLWSNIDAPTAHDDKSSFLHN